MLGYNTNPSVSQFVSIVRKVVVNNEITSSEFANCSDSLDILYVSSHIPNNPHNSSSTSSKSAVTTSNDDIPSNSNESNITEIPCNDEQNYSRREEHLESNTEIGVAYISSEIDKRIQCIEMLFMFIGSSRK